MREYDDNECVDRLLSETTERQADRGRRERRERERFGHRATTTNRVQEALIAPQVELHGTMMHLTA